MNPGRQARQQSYGGGSGEDEDEAVVITTPGRPDANAARPNLSFEVDEDWEDTTFGGTIVTVYADVPMVSPVTVWPAR